MESVDERLARYIGAISGWGSDVSGPDYESAARAAMALADSEYAQYKQDFDATVQDIKDITAQARAEWERDREGWRTALAAMDCVGEAR